MFRNYIKKIFELYDIDDLTVGGHCGCCGKWVTYCIVPKDWAISICERCAN